MKRLRSTIITALSILAISACADQPVGVTAAECSPDFAPHLTPGSTATVPAGTVCLGLNAGDYVLGGYTPGAEAHAAFEAEPLRLLVPRRAALGSRFPIITFAGPDTARVLHATPELLVVLAEAGSKGAAPGTIARDREAAVQAIRHLPRIHTVFPTPRPPASAEGGPLLIVLTRWNPSNGTAATWSDDVGPYSYVALNLDVDRSVNADLAGYDTPGYRLRTAIHELVHAHQLLWSATAADSHLIPGWAAEGTAEMIAGQAAQSAAGVEPGGNWNWQDHLGADDTRFAAAVEPASLDGHVAGGYRNAAAYLRWLAIGLSSRTGQGRDAAMIAVARAAALESQAGGPSADGPLAIAIGGDPQQQAASWAAALGGDDEGVDGDPDFLAMASRPREGWATFAGTVGQPPVAGWANHARLRGGAFRLPHGTTRWSVLRLR